MSLGAWILITTTLLLQVLCTVLLVRMVRGRAERSVGDALLHRDEEAESHFASDLDQLAQLASRLEGVTSLRRVPEVVLDAVQRLFEPAAALVLVRRRRVGDEGKTRFAVAAQLPAEPAWRDEIEIGEGDLGRVAEGWTALERKDLERLPQALPGFETDLAAPMIVAGECIGVIAISGMKSHRHGRRTIGLVAQLGALAMQAVASYAQLQSAADTDLLTGILNRRGIGQRLDEMLAEARGGGEPVSVFLFDIDHFKHYNDRHGHTLGDELLRSLADVVRGAIRSEDVFGRFGGEEFLIVFPGLGEGAATAVADKVRQAIASFAFPHSQRQPLGRVTISGGVAAFPEHGLAPRSLLERADEALYRGKDGGRNRVVSASALLFAAEELS